MSEPTSTALAKRSASTALTDPTASRNPNINTNTDSALTAFLPPAKRIKRPTQALEEEDYEEGINRIIKRDFFPGLAESDAQREYLSALKAGDAEWIVEAGRRLTAATTRPASTGGGGDETPRRSVGLDGMRGLGGETPKGWVGDTPVSRVGEDQDGETELRKKGVDTEMSLAEFQARYTSEDNESFYKLLDRSNRKRTERYSWLWANNKIPTARQLEWRGREQIERQEREASKAIDGGKELITVEYVDKRKAAPDTWKAKPDNNFMFVPDSIEDSMETIQQQKEANSRMGPKRIIYENTRMLPPPRPASKIIPPSPSLSAVRDAIAGRPRLTGSELGSSDVGGGGETPRVNGYAFVDSEEPEHDEGYSASRIDLGPGDSTPNPFTIRAAGGREALHHRMIDRLNDMRQERRHDVAQSPSRGGLTPAAQRLLAKAGGSTPRAKTSLGESWGITPRSKPGLAGVTPARRK